MIILAWDIATVTDFAWYGSGSSLASIKTGLTKPQGRECGGWRRHSRFRSPAAFLLFSRQFQSIILCFRHKRRPGSSPPPAVCGYVDTRVGPDERRLPHNLMRAMSATPIGGNQTLTQRL